MKYCIQCSRQLESGSRFCTNCGANNPTDDTTDTTDDIMQSQSYQQPYQQAQPYQAQPYQQNPYQQHNPYQQSPYQQPYNTPAVQNPGNGNGIAALVLGICSITFLFFVLAIIGIFLAKASDKKQVQAGLPPLGTAKAGMITSIIGLVIGIVYAIIMAFYIAVIVWAIFETGDYYYNDYHYF